MQIKITEENKEQRLDVFLTNELNTTRSNISKHIKLKDIKVNG